ncbi:aromatic acid exporter family protein, partial [Staphylococcus hominis]
PLDGVFKRESKSVSTLKSSVKILEEFDKNQIKSHVIYEILLIYNLLDNRFVKA